METSLWNLLPDSKNYLLTKTYNTHSHTHTHTHTLFFHFGILLSYSNFHSPPSTITRDILNQADEKLARDKIGRAHV